MKLKLFLLTLFVIFSLLLGACGPQVVEETAEEAGEDVEEVVVTEETVEETEEAAEEVEETVETEEPAVYIDEDRVLHLSTNAAVLTLDQQATTSLVALFITKQMYEGLIYYNFEDEVIEPRIAETYEMSTDGLTWTFNLRDDVKFHNGETLTADDVVFSYNRAKEQPAGEINTASIETVTALDENTVEITLEKPVAVFLQHVSNIAIVNEKFVTEHNDDINTDVCGTGPYKADSVDLSLRIEASAFEDYYRGVANIRHITWDVVTDSAAASMALQSGDLDYLQIAFSQYRTMKDNEDLEVGFQPMRHSIYIGFNCSKPPFDNVLVRQAIAYLIDREAISMVTYEGLAVVDSLMLHPDLDGMPDYEVLEQYTYDYNPQKGLELLRQAGYDTSKPIDLGSIRTYAQSHYASKPTLIIQANLAVYGINLEIETMETNAFAAAFYDGDYTMACAAGAYGVDASAWQKVFGTGGASNAFFWGNEELDGLFEQGLSETDPEVRKDIYAEVMRILYEEVPATNMAHKTPPVAWRKDLNPLIRIDYPLIYEWNFLPVD